MLVIPPRDIAPLVSVRKGEYIIDESATQEQKRAFDEWKKEVDKLERETD